MSDIIINVDALQCQSPVMGDTYRTGGTYKFNWSSVWDDYVALGMNAQIRLYYSGDFQPEQPYTGIALPLPGNANMYEISDQFGGFDQVNFRIVFDVDNGDGCSFTFNIPYSSVITN